MYRRFFLSLSICLCVGVCSLSSVNAVQNTEENNSKTEYKLGEKGGYLTSNYSSIKNSNEIRRFSWGEGGKGFAAERANNLSDILHGKNDKIVGNDNLKNGPDRRIINRNKQVIWIQDKYYSSATNSVSAAFDAETGMFRYYDADGKPMKLEVPKGQGAKAIEIMEKKIKDGYVKGIKDPSEAKNIIQEGSYTYEQAKNIAKAGNIDSLKYDAKSGVITSLSATGIAFTLDFASCLINGSDWEEALRDASINSMKVGLGAEVIYVISSQLTKANMQTMFKPATDKIANVLGPKASKALVEVFAEEGQVVTKNAVSNVLQSNLLITTVTVAVFSIPDTIDLFKGRISAKQLAINLAVLIGGATGATIGMVAGGSVGGPLGSFIGGMAGGLAGSYGSETLLTFFFKTDSEEMYDIITNEFSKVSNNYLVSQSEADLITESLSNTLTSDILKDMYESDDREKFANKLIVNLFENQIKKRKEINIPTEEQLRNQMISNMSGVVFIH